MIELEPSPSLSDLPALRQSLLRLIETDPAPRIGTDALVFAPMALLQLLFSAHLSAQARGKRLDITCAPGGALATALQALGLETAVDIAPRIEAGCWIGLTHV